MNLLVACLLVLAMFSSGAVGQRQSVPPSQNTASVPRPKTIRICQGVPIPNGYVIVAYMTSAACPHGAYILKKQDQFEDSLTISRKASAMNDSETAPNTSGNRSPSSRNSVSAKSARDRQPRPAKGTNQAAQAPGNWPQSANVTSSAGNVVSASRPRRVTAEESQEQTDPPTLIGGATARPLTSPKLANMGASSEPPSMDTPAPDSAPKAEEVDENDLVRRPG